MIMKNSVVFYKDWYEAFQELSDEERLQAYDAVLRYAFEGEQPTAKLIRIATAAMRSQIDRDNEKYEDVSRKRKEAVERRWQKYNSMQANTNDTKPTNHTDNDNENVEENVDVDDNEPTNVGESKKEKTSNEVKKKVASQSGRVFKRPTVSEVEAYCKERGNYVNAQQFVDFYESKGWVVGKSPMKDWKAAVRTWEQKDGKPLRKGNVTLGVGEFIDGSGRRTYGTGTYSIPMDAPARPSDQHCWDEASHNWIVL